MSTTFWPGLKLRVYPDSKSSSLALYTRLPEYNEMLFTARLLKAGDVVIDVGANVGLYTLIAATRVGSGRVISIEPHPLAVSRLRENLTLNSLSNVTVRAEAVGARPGKVRLTLGLDTENYVVPGDATSNTTTVSVSTLDDIVDDRPAVALVKLDTEGFESAVLAGATRLLRESRVLAWIVELRGHSVRYGQSDKDVVNEYSRYGYQPYRYVADSRVLKPASAPSPKTEWNLIFIKDMSEVERRLGSAASLTTELD